MRPFGVAAPRSLAVLAAVASSANVGLAFFLHLGFLNRPIAGCDGLFCDFVRHYHPTFQTLYARGAPTEGFLYSPFFALLFAPLGGLDPGAASVLWGILQLASLWALMWVPAAFLFHRGRTVRWSILYIGAVAVSAPVVRTLVWGQVSTLIAALVLGALASVVLGRSRQGALLLAFATALKYFPAAFAGYFLVRREWGFLAWYAGGVAVLLLLVPAVILGPGEAAHFFGLSFGQLGGIAAESWRAVPSQYWPTVVGRWSAILGMPNVVRVVLGLGPALLLVATLVAFLRTSAAGRVGASFALVFLTFPFILEVNWPHYFVYLPFCQVLVLRAAYEAALPVGLSRAATATVLLTLLASSVLVFMWPGPTGDGLLGIPFLSNLLVLAVATVGFLRRRPIPEPAEAAAGASGRVAHGA